MESQLDEWCFCRLDAWICRDADGLARMCDAEITSILDQLIAVQSVIWHQRPSDPRFDHECRAAKRRTRHLEHEVRRTDPSDITADSASSVYLALRRQKCEGFWWTKITARRTPWSTTVVAFQWCSAWSWSCSPSDSIGADDFHMLFDATTYRPTYLDSWM